MRRLYHLRSRGFTLVEVLIGTTILGIMLSLVMSALFMMTKTGRTGQSRLENADAARIVQSFLRRALEQAVPLTELREDGEQHVLFRGERDAVGFVGRLPAHRGGGGLSFLWLMLDEDEQVLVLEHYLAWPWSSLTNAGSSSAVKREKLLLDVKRLRVSYFGTRTDDAPPAWENTWTVYERLPELIKVELERSGPRHLSRITAVVRTQTAVAQSHLIRAGHEGGS